ncbi:hypothetical protein Acr_28g0000220 [Actinidia rufa]|uniref:Uncharacterized protein n=1 Tax=Actinidia rufa TaxID=165716 RepID=A0A7J0H880_9ERIC|nr:hypothetical protein Acr_28g0000220 [Actinidia rufa]
MNLTSTHTELISPVTATITNVSNNSSNQRHHHQNFNTEQRESLANSDHSLSLPGRKRRFAHSAHGIRIFKTGLTFFAI